MRSTQPLRELISSKGFSDLSQGIRSTFRLRALLAVPVSLLAICSYTLPSRAQTEGRFVTLTLLPDLVHRTVSVQATEYPGSLSKEAAGLGDWGLKGEFTIWKADEKSATSPWYLQGTLSQAQIIPEEDGYDHLHIESLQLAPGDSLNLAIPFMNLDYQHISPAPDNLAELIAPAPLDSLDRNPLRLISYSVVNPTILNLDIPFKPLRKEIDLALIPLVGEQSVGQKASFRLAGQVTFDGIHDWIEFLRHCDSAPESSYYRYRVADLLFTLDYPPIYHFGYLLPPYSYKPTYINLSSDIISCGFKSGSGQVAASFSGRAFAHRVDPSLFPEFLRKQDTAESNIAVGEQNHATGLYEIHMGEIILNSGDVLRIAMPGSEISRVDPAPTEFNFDGPGQIHILYQGPQRFALTIDFSYQAGLLLRQFPATVRAYGSPLENISSFPLEGSNGWGTWALLLIGLASITIGSRVEPRYRDWIEFSGWVFLAAAFYFGLRNVFGLMLLAALLYLRAAWPDGRSVVRALVVGTLVILGILADQAAKSLFVVLGSIGEDFTPFTPAILSLLALLAFLTISFPAEKPGDWSSGKILAFALFLFSLSVYDAMQNSLPALVLAVFWAILMVLRARQGEFAGVDVLRRFSLVFRERVFLVGLVILTVFDASYGLAATPSVIATFSPTFGIFRQFLPPILLILSILLSFLSTSALFLLLYPLLPFKEGSLKAVVFSLALLSLFTFGIGSDHRLVASLEQLLVGRFVYYLSIPLLAGIILDVKQMVASEPGAEVQGKSGEAPESPISRFRKGLKGYLEQQENILGTIGALASLVAPTLYAAVLNQPLVTTYFQILRVLITI
jgi:hypothetical protein